MNKIISLLLIAALTISCSHVSKDHKNFSRLDSYRTPSSAALSCREIFNRIYKSDTHDYKVLRKALWKKLDTLDESEKFGVMNALESIHFVDYNFMARELNNIRTRAEILETAQFPFQFNKNVSTPGFFGRMIGRKNVNGMQEVLEALAKNGEYSPPRGSEKAFENFLATRHWLLESEPDFSLESLKEAHRLMMKGGIENLSPDLVGKFRPYDVIGNAPYPRYAITDEQLRVIRDNVYLDFEIVQSGTVDGIQKHGGKILYPTPKNIKSEALERIRLDYPDVYEQVRKLRDLGEGNQKEVTENMVNALTEERLRWFVRQKDQIGDIDSPEKLDQYLDLVVQLQRDFVSIHPFGNGNGRTSREFILNYALMKEGIPPARISDPNLDLYSPLEDWKKLVVKGIDSTERLYTDISNRIDLGLDLNDSPELFLPYFARQSEIDLKKYSSKKITENVRNADVDSKQFLIFLDFYAKKNPDVISELETNPESALKKIDNAYSDFFKKNKVDFVHNKEGLQEVNVNFVDRDFAKLYGEKTFKNKEIWQAKMDQWYMDQTVWRGLSYRNKDMSEDEIVGMFSNFHYQMTSNNVARKINSNTSGEEIRRLVFEDFSQYNEDVFGEGLVEMAKDHSETGPKYGVSYGYSTSKDRKVGKAFAMGAMVIAPYGKQADPELQKQLMSRVVIGAKRAKKDVDLGRLKQVRDEFSYKYGRQQEVMGIGASEPDSIMIVQKIGPDGEVLVSYVRNQHDPSKIHVYASDIRDVDHVDENTLVKVIDIANN